jgi:hypothetical protein
MANLGSAVGNTVKDLGNAVGGTLSDHFKNIATKMSGGEGTQKPISGVAQRMYDSTQDVKASYSILPKNSASGGTDISTGSNEAGLPKSIPQSPGDMSANAGKPSSAGRKAAAPSSTRSTPRDSGKSRPKN